MQYFFNAIELLNGKLFNENDKAIISEKINVNDENKSINNRLDYLYPHLDDKFFNVKIASKKEFSENKFIVKITNETNIEEEANKLCNQEFELAPQQKFIKNFLSSQTPYNGVLLYHGLGTGKTCSAIGIAEETRHYMKYNNNIANKKILIVASPNVQINFRLQLFDENKLKQENGIWVINNCAGQNFLNEINMFRSNISKKRVINIVNNLINNYYSFLGYVEFANLITKHSNIDNILEVNKTLSSKKKNLLIRNKLKKFFDDTLIIVDEIHNIRDSKDNSNKLVAKQFYNLVKNADNLKLVLLSATPMFNDHREIIFLINLLNMNDKRSTIDVNDVFNKDGSFVKGKNGEEIGKELLQRKLNGYVSYVKGDNPFIFPYRILPELFNNEKSIKNEDFVYPKKNIINKEFSNNDNENIDFFDIYLSSMEEYQEKVYRYIINKSDINYDAESYKYTELLKPLEALNIVYPNDILKSTSNSEINSLNIDMKELVGKNGLSKIMTYEQNDYKSPGRYNYKFINNTPNIFLRENLKNYSAKMYSIINSIENSKGPIIIYSQFIDGGLVPMALALESYGFKRYGDTSSLFEKAPVEELDIYSYKSKSEATGKFRTAKYIMITGDKTLSPNKEEELLASNNSDNIYGENVKVILLSGAGSEGLDFKYIRQIHILEPWYNINRIEQIIGRGVRTCSHKDLPFRERNVKIFMYGTLLSNKETETVDLYIYRKAEEKAKQIGIITRMLKEVSIDCNINYDLNNLNADKLNKIINNEFELILSNNEKIKYFIGDKPNTNICDYMESCDYKCYPNKAIDNTENLKTYNERFLETINTKIIKNIGNLFKENYFYTKEDIIKNLNIKHDFSLLAINNALDELVTNELQVIKDKYDRPGRIINIDNLYIYQPNELNNYNSSLYNKSSPYLIRKDSIRYKVPDDIDKKIQIDTVQKTHISEKIDLSKIFKNSEDILKNLFFNYTNILDGNKNFIKKKSDSKLNLLSFVINLNNKNNDIFSIEINTLKKIILNILVDNLNLNSQLNLLQYVYNNYENYLDNDESEYKEIVKYLKNYYDSNIINIIHNQKSIDGFIFPYKSDYEKYTLYILKKEQDKYFLKKGEKMDYNRFNNKIEEKYTITVSDYAPALAYLQINETADFYDFKIKHIDRKSNKHTPGKVCKNFHTIDEKYVSFLNEFIDSSIYEKINSENKLGKYLCAISEIYFRYYDLIKKDDKKWFSDLNTSIINKFVIEKKNK